jgi:hypothetical protein
MQKMISVCEEKISNLQAKKRRLKYSGYEKSRKAKES